VLSLPAERTVAAQPQATLARAAGRAAATALPERLIGPGGAPQPCSAVQRCAAAAAVCRCAFTLSGCCMSCSVLSTLSGSLGHAARHRSATCCAMLSALPVTVA
jgi:hypothetical protein